MYDVNKCKERSFYRCPQCGIEKGQVSFVATVPVLVTISLVTLLPCEILVTTTQQELLNNLPLNAIVECNDCTYRGELVDFQYRWRYDDNT